MKFEFGLGTSEFPLSDTKMYDLIKLKNNLYSLTIK